MSTTKRFTLHYNPKGLSDAQQKLLPILNSNDLYNEEIEKLDEAELAELAKMLNEAIDELNDQHTRLMALMGQAMQMPKKQLIWENNHLKITKVIVSALSHTGSMPSQSYIAATTGLSRKTVQNHIERGNDNSVYVEHLRQYTMMAPRVMDGVLEEALGHDMKAAKLYFDILDKMRGPNAPNIYASQNNYIYINNHVIRQETLSRLSPEQLKQIVEMVNQSKPATEEDAEVVEASE